MHRALLPVVKAVQRLRRPSKRANLRRARARGEDLASIRIRAADAHDVPALAQLHVTTFNATHGLPFGRRPTVELRAAQWRQKLGSSTFCYVAAATDGRLVGFASGEPSDGQPFGGRLEKIYLLPEYQRLGLGHRLVGRVCRRFLSEGITSMILFSQPENPSCAFFDALGGERLLGDRGQFDGAFGWRDLHALAARCPAAD